MVFLLILSSFPVHSLNGIIICVDIQINTYVYIYSHTHTYTNTHECAYMYTRSRPYLSSMGPGSALAMQQVSQGLKGLLDLFRGSCSNYIAVEAWSVQPC